MITHEHQDHVNAITEERFAGLDIDHTWLAWTESADDKVARRLRAKHRDTLKALVQAQQRLAGSPTGRSMAELLALEIGGEPATLHCVASPVEEGEARLLLELRELDQQIRIAREAKLVEQQQAGRDGERAGKRDALLLALAAARVERNRLRLHCQSYQADLDSARAEGVRLRLLNERMLQCITGFVEAVEAAEAHATRPKGGQQVTFSGDFASAVPSVRGQLRWWARQG